MPALWHADPARSFSLSAEAYTEAQWFDFERDAIFGTLRRIASLSRIRTNVGGRSDRLSRTQQRQPPGPHPLHLGHDQSNDFVNCRYQ